MSLQRSCLNELLIVSVMFTETTLRDQNIKVVSPSLLSFHYCKAPCPVMVQLMDSANVCSQINPEWRKMIELNR